MPRPEAQAQVKALCLEAKQRNEPLEQIIRAAHDLPEGFFDPARHMGMAPEEARAFAAAASEI